MLEPEETNEKPADPAVEAVAAAPAPAPAAVEGPFIPLRVPGESDPELEAVSEHDEGDDGDDEEDDEDEDLDGIDVPLQSEPENF